MATSLDDLPISPQTGGNIKLEMNENVVVENPIQNLQNQRANDDKITASNGDPNAVPNGIGSSKDINQFVTGIQQAASVGALNLPSRDIPQQQVHITQDNSARPNYVPQNSSTDYIGSGESSEDIIRRNAQKQQTASKVDLLYNDLQTPILIAVLYFIFQLPIIRKNIIKILPPLFKKDGNPNLVGYVFNSTAFALLYYITNSGISYFSV